MILWSQRWGGACAVATGPRHPVGNPDVEPFLVPVVLPLTGLCFSLRAVEGCCQHPEVFVCPVAGGGGTALSRAFGEPGVHEPVEELLVSRGAEGSRPA